MSRLKGVPAVILTARVVACAAVASREPAPAVPTECACRPPIIRLTIAAGVQPAHHVVRRTGTKAVTAATAFALFQTIVMALVVLGWGRLLAAPKGTTRIEGPVTEGVLHRKHS
jgi:hypothetical protein